MTRATLPRPGATPFERVRAFLLARATYFAPEAYSANLAAVDTPGGVVTLTVADLGALLGVVERFQESQAYVRELEAQNARLRGLGGLRGVDVDHEALRQHAARAA